MLRETRRCVEPHRLPRHSALNTASRIVGSGE